MLQGEIMQPNGVLTMSKEMGCSRGMDDALTCPPKKLRNSFTGQTFSVHIWVEFLTTIVDEACKVLKNSAIIVASSSTNPPFGGVSLEFLARFFQERFLACKGVREVVLLLHASKAF